MTFYQRHVLNLSQIRRETNDHVAMYFYTNEHTDDDYSVIVIEKLYKDDIYRKSENICGRKINTTKEDRKHGQNILKQCF